MKNLEEMIMLELEVDKISNFRGIQGQMWTETVRNERNI